MAMMTSLLVVASSAAVRDYWQKTRHPDMADDTLMTLSKVLTVSLALIAFAIGIGIMLYDIENGVFWIIIFGWSGIAATFCPTIVLSIFWSKLTALGAKCSMIAGFLSVPLFKFAAPSLLDSLGMEPLKEGLAALEVLPPSFAVGMLVALVVSLWDTKGRAKLEGVEAELSDAAARRSMHTSARDGMLSIGSHRELASNKLGISIYRTYTKSSSTKA